MNYVYIVSTVDTEGRETFDRAFVNLGSVKAWIDAEMSIAEFPHECKPLIKVQSPDFSPYWEATIDFDLYRVRRDKLYY